LFLFIGGVDSKDKSWYLANLNRLFELARYIFKKKNICLRLSS
jgi:hypothetical protein